MSVCFDAPPARYSQINCCGPPVRNQQFSVNNRIQIATDGLRPYVEVVEKAFGRNFDLTLVNLKAAVALHLCASQFHSGALSITRCAGYGSEIDRSGLDLV